MEKRDIEAVYDYHSATGTLLLQVVRFSGKEFRQRRPDGAGGWVWNIDGVHRPLYGLPRLLAADPQRLVFIVEGEKDVESVRGLGLVATTTPGGAGNWKKVSTLGALRGRKICIIADKDEAGRRHAAGLAEWLAGSATSVAVMEMPDVGDTPVKDVTDWIEAQDSAETGALAAQLTALAETAARTSAHAAGDPSAHAAGDPAGHAAGDPAGHAAGDPSAGTQQGRLPSWVPPGHGAALATGCPFTHAAGPDLISLADVEPQVLQWLWPGRIPLGKVSLVFGDPGLGKSLLTISMAAMVTRGMRWPDGAECKAGGVVLLSAEDDLADTIRPRFDAAGADNGRVNILRGVKVRGEEGTGHFNISRDLESLKQAVQETPGCRLVIVDPISAYLGGTDTHVNAEVRALLSPLSALAADHHIALVAVTHLNKCGGAKALYRAMGSLAFIAAARAAWLVAPDPDDEGRRFVLPAKLNLAERPTGMAYRVGPVLVGEVGPVARVEWEREPVSMTADEALGAGMAQDSESAAARRAARDWLQALLAKGGMPACEVEAAALAAGIRVSHLRQAKKALGVVCDKSAYGAGWGWSLPGQAPNLCGQ